VSPTAERVPILKPDVLRCADGAAAAGVGAADTTLAVLVTGASCGVGAGDGGLVEESRDPIEMERVNVGCPVAP